MSRRARPLRVAFHAINGVGLGHLVRAVAVATEVRALVDDAQVLVLTNAHDPSIAARAGFDFVQLPPRLGEPHADPARVDRALVPELEEAAMLGALAAFGPDLVVFDTHAPMGVVRRLAAMGARATLVLRELRAEATAALAASGALLSFDRVVIPHEPGDVDVTALGHAAVEVTGPVVRALGEAASRAKARPATRPLVVAIGGGGGQPVDARRYARAVVDAHILARARLPKLETVLVTGPYGEAPRGAARVAGLRVERDVADLPALLARATLVVSQAGYNAVAEIRALAKPAVLVPAHRKAEDQRARALRLARAGAAVIARPEARSIADRVESIVTTRGAVDAMRSAHAKQPLTPMNRAAAIAALRPVWRAPGRVTKVALVAHELAPKLGGMETVARALARGLDARGVDVRVYTTKRLGAIEASGLPPGVVRPLFTPLGAPLRIDLWADLLATIHAAVADAPDVVHLMNAGLAPWVPHLRAALPACVTVHVHGNDLLAPWVRHGLDAEAYRAAQIDGLARADAVLAVSRFSAELATRAGVPERAVEITPNGVDAARFCPGPRDEALAARLGLRDGDRVVLTVSRLAARKGHRLVLRAIAALAPRHPRIKYVFTGSNDALGAELLAEAASLGVASRVALAGFVDDAELPALYRLADVFALVPDGDDASDVEGFGVALLEAAATGLPAVAARTGGVPEAVEDLVSGLLVPKGDGRALEDAIERLLLDGALAKELGARARE
ncbi:MAG TPA: glycosyltransferase, partial [Byssovorax sp.]